MPNDQPLAQGHRKDLTVNSLVTSRARRVALPLLLVVNLMTPLAAGPSGAMAGAPSRALAQPAAAPASGLPGAAAAASWPSATLPSGPSAALSGGPAAALSGGPAAGRGVAAAAPVPPRVPPLPLNLSPGAAPRAAAPFAPAYGSLPMAFEPNRGQTDPRVRFLARGGGYTLFLTGSDAVLSLSQSSPNPRPAAARSARAIIFVGAQKPWERGRPARPGANAGTGEQRSERPAPPDHPTPSARQLIFLLVTRGEGGLMGATHAPARPPPARGPW